MSYTLNQCREMFNNHGGIVIADLGAYSQYSEKGFFVEWCEEFETKYGNLTMKPLEVAHESEDGVLTAFESDWILEENEKGSLTGREYKIYF